MPSILLNVIILTNNYRCLLALWYLEIWDCRAFLDGQIFPQNWQDTGLGAMCLASMCFQMLGLILAIWPHSAHWNSDLPIKMILDWINSFISSSVIPSEAILPGQWENIKKKKSSSLNRIYIYLVMLLNGI